MNTREAIKNIQLVGSGVALLSVAGLVYAINRGLNNHKTYKRKYNADTVEELKGRILELEYSKNKKEELRGVHFFLETKEETIPVHLGPVWFISHQGKRLKRGEKVEVTGSRIDFEGTECIVARSVKRGNETLRLRDESGNPFWHGWTKN